MKTRIASVCLALAALLPAVTHAAELKFGLGIADDHPLAVGARKFADLVKERSAGRLTIATYSSNRLGSDPQMQQALQAGVQQMMLGPPSNLVGVVRDFAVFDLPFTITNYQEADALLDGRTGALLFQKLEGAGLVGLAYWETGFREVTNSKRPIVRAEDLAGLKIRTMQSPVFLESFKALGANAVPMPFTEVYTALETRAIDAQENHSERQDQRGAKVSVPDQPCLQPERGHGQQEMVGWAFRSRPRHRTRRGARGCHVPAAAGPRGGCQSAGPAETGRHGDQRDSCLRIGIDQTEDAAGRTQVFREAGSGGAGGGQTRSG
jgi:tripartite ATP-independent transporter DctP family solute receptor